MAPSYKTESPPLSWKKTSAVSLSPETSLSCTLEKRRKLLPFHFWIFRGGRVYQRKWSHIFLGWWKSTQDYLILNAAAPTPQHLVSQKKTIEVQCTLKSILLLSTPSRPNISIMVLSILVFPFRTWLPAQSASESIASSHLNYGDY